MHLPGVGFRIDITSLILLYKLFVVLLLSVLVFSSEMVVKKLALILLLINDDFEIRVGPKAFSKNVCELVIRDFKYDRYVMLDTTLFMSLYLLIVQIKCLSSTYGFVRKLVILSLDYVISF